YKVGGDGDEDAHEEEEGPRDHSVLSIGLVDAHSLEAGPEASKLVISIGELKIAAGSFLPQGSLLAAIKEDGSKRSLLAAMGSERCVLWFKG
ncbi:hypothetical protein B296_00031037, partial [Ensete ventricosum]